MTGDSETLKIYGERAGEYARMIDDGQGDPCLAPFIAALPKGAHVLDLGCGPGWAAAHMATAGLTVTATDAVPEMVALAAQHPGVSAQVASFDDISGTNLYTGIWANFSLLHAPRSEMPGHLSALRRALCPGGIFHIGLKTGTGEERDKIGRLYTYYTANELNRLLIDAGFAPFSSRTGTDPGLSGEPAPWIAITCHG